MKLLKTVLVAVAVLGPLSARAEDGFTVLYQQGSWTVFRFDSSKPGDPPSYCSAKSGKSSAFFELIGTEQVSCLSAETSKWTFRKRQAEVGFFVGSSGFFLDPGNYFSNGLQLCGPRENVGIFIDSLSRAHGKSIDVYDYKRQKIGSFPAAGMENAVRKWKACLNSL